MEEVKKALDELRSLYESEFKTLRDRAADEADKHGEALGETKAALDAVQEKMTAFEETATKTQARMDALDALVQNIGEGSKGESDEVKAFHSWLQGGVLSPDEAKNIMEASDADGGVFVPTEIDAQLVKGILEFSPVRQLVSVRTTGAQSRKFRKRTQTAGAATWVGEVESRGDTGGMKYAFDEVPTHELWAEHFISRWELDDAVRDMEAELMQEWADQFALAEGTAVIAGTGFKQPEGIIVNSEIADVNAAGAGDVTAGDVIGLKYELKEGYLNGPGLSYIFNRKTLKHLRLLQDANDRYLWQPALDGMGGSIPATIDGTRYVLAPDMEDYDAAAGHYPVAVGNFNIGYVLLDRRGTQAQRDPYTSASTGLVKLSAFRRLGGQVLVPEAIKRLITV